MHFDYKTKGTCSKTISFEIEGDVVRGVKFCDGCDGNLKAVSTLVDGWTVEEIEAKLTGITCGRRNTSCAAQLAKAVRAGYEAQRENA